MFIDCKKVVEQTKVSTAKIEIYNSIEEIVEQWMYLAPEDYYWQFSYHMALENALPQGLTPYYAIITEADRPIGLVYMQHKRIDMSTAIRGKKNVFSRLLLSWLNMDTLVVGNLLLTGKYGFSFRENISSDVQFNFVNLVVEKMTARLLESKINIGPIIIKDFFEEECAKEEVMPTFTKFKVQPNMIASVRPEWREKIDYAEAMKSKARIRYRRARKKMSNITCKELTLSQIKEHKEVMYSLYKNISEQAAFNLFVLHPNYFYSLKENLGEKLIVCGYFKDGEMIAFYTMMSNSGHVDAHFLGYNKEVNKTDQIYLNMLFDMMEEAIEERASKVCLSRTAMAIKSSVGAEPNLMYCYLKHHRPFLNKLVPYIVQYLYKEEEWEERNPFKD
jgi:hypothetical protein